MPHFYYVFLLFLFILLSLEAKVLLKLKCAN